MKKYVDFAKVDFPPARTRGAYSKGHPKGLIVHYTSGHPHAKLKDSISWQVTKGFCYFVIDSEGNLAQNFPLDRWGYHAGDSTRYPSAWPTLGFGVSDQCVGVEVCCPGKLTSRGQPNFSDQPYAIDYQRPVEAKDNIEAGIYYKYTEQQEETLVRLCKWLKANAPDVFNYDHVLGHDEVAGPKGLAGRRRKSDPGGSLSMTMSDFRAKLKESQPMVQRKNNVSANILTWQNQTKTEWFASNAEKLKTMVTKANEQNENSGQPLTNIDCGTVLNAELGLTKDGRVDEYHTHSLGEIGPLPLPSSLRYWVPDAKPSSAQRTADENVFDFLRYLAAVKTKDVGRSFAAGRQLYRDLFSLPSVIDDDTAQARLLAAAIHGYFLPGNYEIRLPLQAIAYRAVKTDGTAMADLINECGYKHPDNVVKNRLTNITAGKSLLS